MSRSYEEKVKGWCKDNKVDGRWRICFRVEDDNGVGPYQGRDDTGEYHMTKIGGSYACTPRRPSPHQDGLGWVDKDHVFGFDDIEQLRRWFTVRERKALEEVGCGVSVYRLIPGKHIRVGVKQIVFKPQYAEKIGKIKI